MRIIITGIKIISHQLMNINERPIYKLNNPRYIGFLVNEYTPVVCNEEAGLNGITVVLVLMNCIIAVKEIKGLINIKTLAAI